MNNEKKGQSPPTFSTGEKRDLLLEYEKLQAKKLARMVFDKPKPPLWMILIPVFFVFFAWKLKEYKNGIQSFAQDWMISRERCLDAAYDAITGDKEPQLSTIVTAAKEVPPEAIPLYRDWMEVLAKYYCHLLNATGNDMSTLVRSHFHTKSNYLLTQKQINKVEHAYHKALLPSLKGDRENLEEIVSRIFTSTHDLQREQADAIFR